MDQEDLESMRERNKVAIPKEIEDKWNAMKSDKFSQRLEYLCNNAKIPHCYFELWSQIHQKEATYESHQKLMQIRYDIKLFKEVE